MSDVSVIKINKNLFIINNLSEIAYVYLTTTVSDSKNNIIYPIPTDDDSKIKINNNNSLFIKRKYIKKNLTNIFFFKKKTQWTFLKFKYHGKGFKIKKYNSLNKITLRFGKSHWSKILYNSNVMARRTKKNTYTVLTLDKNFLKNVQIMLLKSRGINMYTKRGVRLNRIKLKRRFGKVSQASSVYK